MKKNQGVIAVLVIALLVMAAFWSVVRLGGELSPADRLGVDLVVNPEWVTLEGHYVTSDRGGEIATNSRDLDIRHTLKFSGRGGTVPDQAWEGEVPHRGATVEKTVRLAVLPNLVGRVRENVVVVRAVGHAALTVMRYLTGYGEAPDRSAANKDTGDRNADRG